MDKAENETLLIEGDPPIHWHDTLASTNTEALRLGEEGAPHHTAVVARYQTQGRGKLASRWVMPRGEGVLLSILLRRVPESMAFTQLTLQVGWRLAQLLRELTGLAVEVKKPNDLMIEGLKLAGILSEARWRGEKMLYAVVGVGINVNVQSFPDELTATACSLSQVAGKPFNVEEITRAVIECLRGM